MTYTADAALVHRVRRELELAGFTNTAGREHELVRELADRNRDAWRTVDTLRKANIALENSVHVLVAELELCRVELRARCPECSGIGEHRIGCSRMDRPA